MTWFQTEGEDSISVADSTDLWGTWLHPNAVIDDNNVTDASADYSFDYRVYDLFGAQRAEIGNRLGLRFEAGLRRAEVDQELEIDYLQQLSDVLYRESKVTYTSDFTGWGPRFGMGGDWHLAGGFNLFGSFAGSVLLGNTEMALQELDWNAGAVDSTTRIDVTRKFSNRVVPVVEARIGIGYERQFADSGSIGARFGYEWQNWFNMVSGPRYTDDVDGQLMNIDTTDVGLGGFFCEGVVTF